MKCEPATVIIQQSTENSSTSCKRGVSSLFGSAFKITANRSHNFTESSSSNKREKFKEMNHSHRLGHIFRPSIASL